MDINQQIKQQLEGHPVVLYMKGTPQFPQCGFSALAVELLKTCLGSTKNIFTVNVLLEPDIRQGIKEFSSWPTIPQLYIKGEFVGGADIIKQMYEAGELQTKLANITTPE